MLENQVDRERTKSRKFLSRGSYVTFRIHPGTKHHCVYLAGEDAHRRREYVYRRSVGRCENCRAFVSPARAEMDHMKDKRKFERCWCKENLRILCPRCHAMKHNRYIKFAQKEVVICSQHPKIVIFDGFTCPACKMEQENNL